MDYLRAGRTIRALRIRANLRQEDLAQRVGLSRAQIGRIERGELARIPIGDVQSTIDALGADADLRLRWHGEGLDRLLDSGHATLVELMVKLLKALGWECVVEASFSIYGERGSVDILAWHAGTGTLLVIEIKTVVPDAQAMLHAHDVKVRLGPEIGRARGWNPASVARLLVIADGATSRRRVDELGETFTAAYPVRARAVRRWLKAPDGPLAGILFLSYGHGLSARRSVTGRQRVRRPKEANASAIGRGAAATSPEGASEPAPAA